MFYTLVKFPGEKYVSCPSPFFVSFLIYNGINLVFYTYMYIQNQRCYEVTKWLQWCCTYLTFSSCPVCSGWVYCLLNVCVRYVEGVLDGSISPDNAVGRTVWDLVQSVPKVGTRDVLYSVGSFSGHFFYLFFSVHILQR